MLAKIKAGSLVICLFLFLFVVIGSGLHLNPGGAFLAAATGTPLAIHVLNRWGMRRAVEEGPQSASPDSLRRTGEARANHPAAFDAETVAPQ